MVLKINPLTAAVRFLNQVQEKQDANGNPHDRNSKDQKKKNEKSQEDSNNASPSQVSEAVEKFRSDAQAKANGLTANLEGSGPGLRVVLKDVSGSVIRQFTGAEFLSLREATLGESQSPGKILDQKL
ncbi:MAG: hypothetical protein AABZ55_01060 [Bdellovibrionota bacterium]|mgnify:CR=1 FL=1